MLQKYNIVVHLLQRENKMAASRQTNTEAFVLVCLAISLFVLKLLYRRLATVYQMLAPCSLQCRLIIFVNYLRHLWSALYHTRMVRHVM